MKKSLKRVTVISVAAAALFAATSTGSAQAIGINARADCTITGGNGAALFQNWTNNYTDISMNTMDTAADRHHTAVRFISKSSVNGSIRYWSWHHNYKGADKILRVSTSASTARGGLSHIGIQVAVMEGSEVLRSCKDWAVGI